MISERAYDRLWEERQTLARECANLRDERDGLAREIQDLREHISVIDHDRRMLTEELEKATGRDWTAEQARSWSE